MAMDESEYLPPLDTIYTAEARVTVLARPSGRAISIFTGYRNSCAYFDDLEPDSCWIFFDAVEGEAVRAGETCSAQIQILGPAMIEGKLYVGSRFHLKVAHDHSADGVITKVFGVRRVVS